jgi:hypothetical protein
VGLGRCRVLLSPAPLFSRPLFVNIGLDVGLVMALGPLCLIYTGSGPGLALAALMSRHGASHLYTHLMLPVHHAYGWWAWVAAVSFCLQPFFLQAFVCQHWPGDGSCDPLFNNIGSGPGLALTALKMLGGVPATYTRLSCSLFTMATAGGLG